VEPSALLLGVTNATRRAVGPVPGWQLFFAARDGEGCRSGGPAAALVGGFVRYSNSTDLAKGVPRSAGPCAELWELEGSSGGGGGGGTGGPAGALQRGGRYVLRRG